MDRKYPALDALFQHLSRDDQRRLRQLLDATQSPPGVEGLLHLIRAAKDSISAVREFTNLPRLDRLFDWLVMLEKLVLGMSDLPVHLKTRPDLRPLAPAYRMFLETCGTGYRREVVTRMLAVRGLALAQAFGSNNEIPESFASHWLTLSRAEQKSGALADRWSSLAENLPISQDDITAYDARWAPQSIRDFLLELRQLLLDGRVPDLPEAAPLPQTAALPAVAPPVPPEHQSTPLRASAEQDKGNPPDAQGDNQDEPPDETATKEGFVRWQSERGQMSQRLAACGIQQGWHFLHFKELRRRTRVLVKQMQSPRELERKLACLALLSLLVGLPPRLVLAIALARNDDLWLDLEAGVACWSLAQIISRQTPEEWILEASYRPTDIVRIPMIVLLQDALLEFRKANPSATRVGELLFTNEEISDVLSRFHVFLRDGDETSHGSYPSRFAYSYGRLLLHVTGQDAIAVLGSLDFALGASSQLDYVCVHEDLLHGAISVANEYLGLGPTIEVVDRGWIGSPLRPRDDVIVAGWRRMEADCYRLKKLAAPNCSLATFVDAFNERSEIALAATCFLAASRGTRLSRLTYALLLRCPDMLLLSDKEVTRFVAYRVVARHPLLANTLDGQLENLRALVKRLEFDDREMFRKLCKLADGQRPFFPFFFTVELIDDRVRLRRFRTKDLARIMRKYFGATENCGRHFWASALVERNAPRYLPRVLTGHFRKDFTPHGAAMAMSPREACSALSREMEGITRSLGLQPLTSFRKPLTDERTKWPSIPARIPFLSNAVVDEFLEAEHVNGGAAKTVVESPPVDRYSLLGWAVTEALRTRLASGQGLPDPGGGLLLSLMVFGGQFSPTALHAIWNGLQSGKISRLGAVPIVEANYQDAEVAIPLVPPVALFLDMNLGREQSTYSQAMEQLRAWLVCVYPGTEWPASPQDTVFLLGALVQRWLRLEISPHLFVCSDPQFGAAAISLSSIARVAYGRPRASPGDVQFPDTPPGKRLGKLADELEVLYQAIAKYADTRLRVGENQRRRTLISVELSKISGSLSKLAMNIWEWLYWEVTHDGAHAYILDVASLASYLSKLKEALCALDPEVDIDDLDSDEWNDLKTAVKGAFTGRSLDQRLSILKRFALHWRLQGVAVPRFVFADDGRGRAEGGHQRRASATHISLADGAAIESLMRHRLDADSLILEKALAQKSIMEHGPFRIGEAVRIGTADLDADIHGVVVTSSGFGHLKTKTSRRIVVLPEPTHKQITSLRDRVLKLSGHSRFVWLRDNQESMHQDADASTAMLRRFLVVSTGEAQARTHSLRGSVVNRAIESPRLQ